MVKTVLAVLGATTLLFLLGFFVWLNWPEPDEPWMGG